MGAETGGSNQGINPEMQKMLARFGPIVVFACSIKVSSVGFLYFQKTLIKPKPSKLQVYTINFSCSCVCFRYSDLFINPTNYNVYPHYNSDDFMHIQVMKRVH